MLLGVGGPRAVTDLATWQTRAAAKRPTHSTQSEIRFLEYRLAVVETWPDSGRRKAVIKATVLRLVTLGRASSLSFNDSHATVANGKSDSSDNGGGSEGV